MSRQLLENARGPGKAEVRTKVVEVLRNVRDLCNAGRQACSPETTRYVPYADIVQQVHCLLVPLPAQSDVQGQVGFNAPIILAIKRSVILAEVEVERPVRQRQRRSCALDELAERIRCC